MAKKWIAGAIKKPGALHKEMGVPEGNIGYWDVVTHSLGGGHGDSFVGQGRAADRAERFVAKGKLVVNLEAIADGEEGLALTSLGALTVTDVERGGGIVTGGEGGAHAGVHTSAEQDDGALAWVLHELRLESSG